MKVTAFKIWLEYFTGSGCFNSAISTLQFTLKLGFLSNWKHWKCVGNSNALRSASRGKGLPMYWRAVMAFAESSASGPMLGAKPMIPFSAVRAERRISPMRERVCWSSLSRSKPLSMRFETDCKVED